MWTRSSWLGGSRVTAAGPPPRWGWPARGAGAWWAAPASDTTGPGGAPCPTTRRTTGRVVSTTCRSVSTNHDRHLKSSRSERVFMQAIGRTGAQANIMGQGIGRAWRSNSMDVLPYVESDSAHFSPALAQIAQLSKLSQQQQLTAKLGQAATANQKLAMMRWDFWFDIIFYFCCALYKHYTVLFSALPGPMHLRRPPSSLTSTALHFIPQLAR